MGERKIKLPGITDDVLAKSFDKLIEKATEAKKETDQLVNSGEKAIESLGNTVNTASTAIEKTANSATKAVKETNKTTREAIAQLNRLNNMKIGVKNGKSVNPYSSAYANLLDEDQLKTLKANEKKYNKLLESVKNTINDYRDFVKKTQNEFETYEGKGSTEPLVKGLYDINAVEDSAKKYIAKLKENNVKINNQIKNDIIYREKAFDAYNTVQKQGSKIGTPKTVDDMKSLLEIMSKQIILAKKIKSLTNNIGYSDSRFDEIDLTKIEESIRQYFTKAYTGKSGNEYITKFFGNLVDAVETEYNSFNEKMEKFENNRDFSGFLKIPVEKIKKDTNDVIEEVKKVETYVKKLNKMNILNAFSGKAYTAVTNLNKGTSKIKNVNTQFEFAGQAANYLTQGGKLQDDVKKYYEQLIKENSDIKTLTEKVQAQVKANMGSVWKELEKVAALEKKADAQKKVNETESIYSRAMKIRDDGNVSDFDGSDWKYSKDMLYQYYNGVIELQSKISKTTDVKLLDDLNKDLDEAKVNFVALYKTIGDFFEGKLDGRAIKADVRNLFNQLAPQSDIDAYIKMITSSDNNHPVIQAPQIDNAASKVDSLAESYSKLNAEIDNWIDNNINKQLYPPVYRFDDHEQAVKTIKDYISKLNELKASDGYNTMSKPRKEDVDNTITYLSDLIKIEEKAIEANNRFNKTNLLDDEIRKMTGTTAGEEYNKYFDMLNKKGVEISEILEQVRKDFNLTFDEVTQKWVKLSSKPSGLDTINEYIRKSEEIFGAKKATNIDELYDMYSLMKAYQRSIEDHPNTEFARESRKFQEEIVALNPQLERLLDNWERLTKSKFKATFGSAFENTTLPSSDVKLTPELEAQVSGYEELAKNIQETLNVRKQSIQTEEEDLTIMRELSEVQTELAKPVTVQGTTDQIKSQEESLKSLLNELKLLQETGKNGNNYILPRYHNGVLQDDYGGQIRQGSTTKKSITDAIKYYNDQKSSIESGETFYNEKTLERALDDLAKYVAGYKNLDEAQSLFGKKNKYLWEQVIDTINRAKAAQEAYETYDVKQYKLLKFLNTDVMKFGDYWKVEEYLKKGDTGSAFNYLIEKYGLVEQASNESANQQIKATEKVIEANNQEINSNEEVIASEEKKRKYRVANRENVPRLKTTSNTTTSLIEQAQAAEEVVKANNDIIKSEQQIERQSKQLAKQLAAMYSVVNPETINKVAGMLLEKFNNTESLKVDENGFIIADNILDEFDLFASAPPSFESIFDVLAKDADFFIEKAEGASDEYKKLRDYVTHSKILIDSKLKNEFGDKKEWDRIRTTIGMNTMTTNEKIGTPINNYLEELNKQLGTTFDITTSAQDGVRQLSDELIRGRNGISQLDEQIKNREIQNIEEVTNTFIANQDKIDKLNGKKLSAPNPRIHQIKQETTAIKEQIPVIEEQTQAIVENTNAKKKNKQSKEDTNLLSGSYTIADGDIESLLRRKVDEINSTTGMEKAKYKILTDAQDEVLSAEISYVNKKLGQVVTEMYALHKANEEIKGDEDALIFKGKKLSQDTISAEEKKQKAIERSNTFLSKQSELIKDIQFLYNKQVNPHAKKVITDPDDLKQLETLYKSIQSKINNNKNTDLSSDFKDQLIADVKELNRVRKSLTDKWYGASEMSPAELNIGKTIRINQYDTFIEKLKLAGSYTDELRSRVEATKESIDNIGSSSELSGLTKQLQAYREEFRKITLTENGYKEDQKTLLLSEKKNNKVNELIALEKQLTESGKLTDTTKAKLDSLFDSLSNVSNTTGLSIWNEQLKNFKSSLDDIPKTFEEKWNDTLKVINESQIKQFQNERKESVQRITAKNDGNVVTEKNSIMAEQARAEIEAQNQKIKEQKEEYDALIEKVNELAKARKDLKSLESQAYKNKDSDVDYTARIQAQKDLISRLIGEIKGFDTKTLFGDDSVLDNKKAKFEAYADAITKAENAQEDLNNQRQLFSEKDQQAAIEDYKKALSDLEKAYKSFASNANGKGNLSLQIDYQKIAEAQQRVKELGKSAMEAGVSASDLEKLFANSFREISSSAATEGVKTLDEYRNKINSLSEKMEENGTATDKTRDRLKGLKEAISSIIQNADFSNNEGLGKFLSQVDQFGIKLRPILSEIEATGKFDSKILSIEGSIKDFDKLNIQTIKAKSLLTTLKDEYKSLQDSLANNNGKFGKDQVTQLQRIEALVKKINQEAYGKGTLLPETAGNITDIKSLKAAMQNYAKTEWNAAQIGRILNNGSNELTGTFKAEDGTIHKLTATMNSLHNGMNIVKDTTSQSVGFFTEMGNVIKTTASRFSYMFSGYMMFHRITSAFRDGLNVLKDYDSALTTISYTMDLTKKQLNNLGDSAVQMAKDLSMSLDNAMSIYQIYANMNTTAQEINETAMPTAILSNLSGVDTSTSSDQVQGILQQFSMLKDGANSAADASMHVVDVLDKISASVAIDYSKGIGVITDAVTATGQVAYDAGLSFEQLAAISAKVAERTREDGSTIGCFVYTIKII